MSETAPRCSIRTLSVLSYAQGFTQWHYRTDGQGRRVLTDGYFQPAEDMAVPGDMILVSAPDGGAMLFVRTVKPFRVELMVGTAHPGDPGTE